ncbi:holo-ACP synthase [Stenoxybacter acetivorans]|uniref:holo-ACP synthase n=1 Tax=Stenoxybacter acetivorans TaxID=422441 RepID=UPI0005623D6B|nr:holo-ACP synthase [Stenoxybacter acetivorans]
MIYGIGTDLVSLSRVEKICKTHGVATVAAKLLTRIELLECPSAHQNALFFAKRFAAKEAFSKAVHTGLRSPVTLHNIGIGHDRLGRPEFILETPLQNWLAERGIGKIHLSLSDEADYITAFVVAEKA